MTERKDRFSGTSRGSPRLQTRPRFKSLREFELSPNDVDRFCAELRKEFPTIRFLLSDYVEHWIEREFGKEERDPETGHVSPVTVSESMRAPHGEPMPYADSFRQLPDDRLTAWVEPEGWRPQWSSKPYRRGRYVLLNEPALQFVFFPASYVIQGPQNVSKSVSEPPARLGEDEICVLYGGFMFGRYFLDDLRQQEFLRTVWRIARRVTTNKLVRVDCDALKSRPMPAPTSLRVGHDAAEWTRHNRRHLIGVDVEYAFRAADAFR